ncbi:hypothetical protein [Psychrobacter alimentarius]|uniref:hypothetical protein n=2 Tax=Psychrobacter alimentarius TaxID=261164 RepID=UPI001917F391|nr:hypothetical protein [Psychrobacter alimentarius]
MDTVKFMTERLLSFADDIVAVDRQEVIDFFESENAPYRDDHVEFLTRFGGNNFTAFLKKQDCFFDFSTVKGLYEDDKDFPDDVELQEGSCHFANPFYSNFLCIEQSTGIIYREEVDETGNPVLNEIVWCDIKSFLFMASLYYLEKISIKLSHDSYIANSWITDFKQSNEAYLLDVNDSDMAYYLKEDMFYCLSRERSYLITYKLYTEFCEGLKDKRLMCK